MNKKNPQAQHLQAPPAFALLSIFILLGLIISIVIAERSGEKRSFQEEIEASDYGKFTLNYSSPATPEDLGIPLYPGAELERSFVYSAKEKDGEGAGYLAQAFLITSDTPEKVADFYKSQMGRAAGIDPDSKKDEIFLFSSLNEDTLTVRITSPEESKQTHIELSRARLSEITLKEPPQEEKARPRPARPPRQAPQGIEASLHSKSQG